MTAIGDQAICAGCNKSVIIRETTYTQGNITLCSNCKTIEKQWKRLDIKNFKITENWGDPGKMDSFLMCALDRVRQEIGKPFVIHCGYESSRHASKSYRYKGQAIDLHVDGIGLYTAYYELNKLWWFGGVGIYPHWNKPGFHLDVGPYRRWARNSEGKYTRIVNGVFQ